MTTFTIENKEQLNKKILAKNCFESNKRLKDNENFLFYILDQIL